MSPAKRKAQGLGVLAAIDHLLRGAPPPVNPYAGGIGRSYFTLGVEQAQRFAASVQLERVT